MSQQQPSSTDVPSAAAASSPLDNTLRPLFYTKYSGPATGNGFAEFVRRSHPELTVASINEWRGRQAAAQIHFEQHRPTRYSSVLAYRPNEDWQMDLFTPDAAINYSDEGGPRFVLVVIDVFSRKLLSLAPLQDKQASTIAPILRGVMDREGSPTNINCDRGGEFAGPVKALCNQRHVRLIYSQRQEPNKNAIVERFMRTLRAYITQQVSIRHDHRWARFLNPHTRLIVNTATGANQLVHVDGIIDQYNKKRQGTTRVEPDTLRDELDVSRQRPNFVTHNLEPGDRVRIRTGRTSLVTSQTGKRVQNTFKKGPYHFSTRVHTIRPKGPADRGDKNKLYIQNTPKYFKPYELRRVGSVQEGPGGTYPGRIEAVKKGKKGTKIVIKKKKVTARSLSKKTSSTSSSSK